MKEYVEGHDRFGDLLNEHAWKIVSNQTGEYTQRLAEIGTEMDDLAHRLDRLSEG